MISARYLKLLEELRDMSIKARKLDYNLARLQVLWNSFPYNYKMDHNSTIQYLEIMSLVARDILCELLPTTPQQLCIDLTELHRTKNAGYSGTDIDPWANFREITKFGISAEDGVLTRLSDKFVRFQNVYKNGELDQVSERAVDTLTDFIAYCLILVCLLEEIPATNNHLYVVEGIVNATI